MGLEIPGYKVLRTLGRGGMATVYLAQQEIFERQVALKVMSKALAADESFGKRFFREAKIVSQLVHPNIVTVHDVGVANGHYYLSMEYIDGSDLKHIRHQLSLRQKIQAVADIAKALDYAGSKGFIHRDIKPENIMFHKTDGRAVLTDFGIAKAAEADTAMTQAGTAIGTPHYMSPEQAKGKAVDPRSDIYSLGVVFFLLLAGRVPFDAESAVAIGIKHITEPVPLLPEGLDALQPIIDTLLAKKPENRYQHAAEFVDDVALINIELLEQSISYAQELQQPDSADSDTPTEKHRAISAVDLAVAYDDQDTIINERTSLMSWFVGFLIAFSLVGWLLYYQKPEWITPWLEKGKTLVEEGYNNIQEPKVPREPIPQRDTKRSIEQAEVEVTPVKKPASSTRTKPRIVADAKPSIERVDNKQHISPATAVTPSSAPKPRPSPAMSIAAYEKQLSELQNRYTTDSVYLAELVELQRRFIRDYPAHAAAEKSLATLRASELAQVNALIDQGKMLPAKKRLGQLRALFPDIADATFSRLERKIALNLQIEHLLGEAQQYLQQRQYTSPAGSNAAERYRQVLRLDSTNTDAISGFNKALANTVTRGYKELERKRYQQALVKAERVLALNAGHKKALGLKRRAQAAIDYQVQIQSWFTLASRRLRSHHYFTPDNDSAYDYYDQILRREPGNTEAMTSQKRVVDAFARNIWSLVGDEDFVEVREQIAVAKRKLPGNQRLQSLSAAVEEVLADKVISP